MQRSSARSSARVAGYYGGVIDAIVTWATGAVVSLPAVAFLLIVVIFRWPVTPFEFGLWLTIYLWTGVARVVRGSFVALRHREFVEAAHAAGASGPRIILRHLLPNASGPLIVAGTSLIGQSIVIVATVTFLGLGTVQAEKPSLGTLVADAARGTGGNLLRNDQHALVDLRVPERVARAHASLRQLPRRHARRGSEPDERHRPVTVFLIRRLLLADRHARLGVVRRVLSPSVSRSTRRIRWCSALRSSGMSCRRTTTSPIRSWSGTGSG